MVRIHVQFGPSRPQPAAAAYRRLMTLKNIIRVYGERVAGVGGPGLDRVSPAAFESRRAQELRTLFRKAHDRSYRFTPYLEGLLPKGREKAPRLISKPTVRDRVFLSVLKDVLHCVFPERVQRTLPNAHVRQVRSYLEHTSHSNLHFLRADIKGFYDSIDHGILEERLGTRIRSSSIRSVVMRAVQNPTVPSGYRRKRKKAYAHTQGVPQGLAISNILANVFLGDLDAAIGGLAPVYHRYVDDILVVGEPSEVAVAKNRLATRLGDIGLELNLSKSYDGELSDGFEFLGYRFDGDMVTVREKTVDRFISGLAGRFTSWREGWEEQKKIHPWLDDEGLRQVLVEELNLVITGAISGNRRYGWLFYFLETNDPVLMHRLDAVLTNFFQRSPLFGARPSGAKRFARAIYEARFRPNGGYLVNYDAIATTAQKTAHLRRFGLLARKRYSPAEINDIFERDRSRRLRRLEQDIGRMS